jgi:hypothetical protein
MSLTPVTHNANAATTSLWYTERMELQTNHGGICAPTEGRWKQRLRLRDQCLQVALELLEELLFAEMLGLA